MIKNATFPFRPRLVGRVAARRHFTDGHARVVLRADDEYLEMSAQEWEMLALADGTRDFDGVVLAATHAGVYVGARPFRELLEFLHARGLLANGLEDVDESPAKDAFADAPDAALAPRAEDPPVDPLPGYGFACDGLGECCNTYESITFTPLEALRARVVCPEVLATDASTGPAFVPAGRDRATTAFAVAMVDGACAYLGADGRCAIHARGGADAKPSGCGAFPLTLVDDGVAVRASVVVECPCVLASATHARGAPLVDRSARTLADLRGRGYRQVDDRFALTATRLATRVELVGWSRAVLATVGSEDTVAAFWSLAVHAAREGLSERSAARALTDARRPSPDAVAPWLTMLHRNLDRLVADDATWRSARDPSHRYMWWARDAARQILDPAVCAEVLARGADDRISETFHLAAVVHGHELVGGYPLVASLMDRAVRVLVARVMARALPSPPDPALRYHYPLATLNRLIRGRGISAYVQAALRGDPHAGS